MAALRGVRRRRGEQVRCLAWQGRGVRDAAGQPTHVTGIVTDITARKEAEARREPVVKPYLKDEIRQIRGRLT